MIWLRRSGAGRPSGWPCSTRTMASCMVMLVEVSLVWIDSTPRTALPREINSSSSWQRARHRSSSCSAPLTARSTSSLLAVRALRRSSTDCPLLLRSMAASIMLLFCWTVKRIAVSILTIGAAGLGPHRPLLTYAPVDSTDGSTLGRVVAERPRAHLPGRTSTKSRDEPRTDSRFATFGRACRS